MIDYGVQPIVPTSLKPEYNFLLCNLFIKNSLYPTRQAFSFKKLLWYDKRVVVWSFLITIKSTFLLSTHQNHLNLFFTIFSTICAAPQLYL